MDVVALNPRWWVFNKPFAYSVLILAFFSSDCFAADEDNNNWQDSVVQVLTYKGDQLFNQGSGVLIAEGVIVTSAHLLEGTVTAMVKDAHGQKMPAVVVNKNVANDLAVLRAEIKAPPITLSLGSVSEKDVLEIGGYWHLEKEKPRKSFFGFSKKPDFIAVEVPKLLVSKAIPDASSIGSENLKMVTSVGRGAYGAPLVNDCGELVGIVRTKPGQTTDDLWQPHVPLGAIVTKLAVLEGAVKALSITLTKAVGACLSAAEKQKAEEQAKQKAKQKANQKALDKSKQKAKLAEAEADKAKKEAEKEKQARQDAEKDREDISAMVSEINKKAELVDSEYTEVIDQKETLFWSVVAAVVVALLIIIALVIKRNRDLSRVNQALDSASASFGDCRFEGRDSAGAPIAFVVLGKDLLQRESGLILGRNPDVAQVVIADDTVSRQHAVLSVKDSHLFISDLDSTGGTRVNGAVVTADGMALISGDQIEFGEVSCLLAIKG